MQGAQAGALRNLDMDEGSSGQGAPLPIERGRVGWSKKSKMAAQTGLVFISHDCGLLQVALWEQLKTGSVFPAPAPPKGMALGESRFGSISSMEAYGCLAPAHLAGLLGRMGGKHAGLNSRQTKYRKDSLFGRQLKVRQFYPRLSPSSRER